MTPSSARPTSLLRRAAVGLATLGLSAGIALVGTDAATAAPRHHPRPGGRREHRAAGRLPARGHRHRRQARLLGLPRHRRHLRRRPDDGPRPVLSKGPGTPSLGLKVDGRRLWVAGGSGGDGRVVDTRTGRVLRALHLHHAARASSTTSSSPGGTRGSPTRCSPSSTASTGRHPGRSPVDRAADRGLDPDAGGQQRQRHRPDAGRQGAAGGQVRHRAAVPRGRRRGPGHPRRPRRGRADQRRRAAAQGPHPVRGPEPPEQGRRGRSWTSAAPRAAVRRTITSPAFDVPSTVARSGQYLYLPNARFGAAEPRRRSRTASTASAGVTAPGLRLDVALPRRPRTRGTGRARRMDGEHAGIPR